MSIRRKLTKASKNPKMAAKYLLSGGNPSVKKEDGVVTWDGDYWGNADSPYDVLSSTYHEYQSLEALLSDQEFAKALEVGCGYGRLTPWLELFADEVVGLDPNGEVIERALRHYSHIDFRVGKIQDAPFSNGLFDLIVTSTVLQHIPTEHIEQAASEIERLLADDGVLVITEETEGSDPDGSTFWVRPRAEYRNIFNHLQLSDTYKYERPWRDDNAQIETLKFTWPNS